MNELQIFKNEEFGEIRTVTINDEPWFVGKDIAEVLGYAEPRSVVSKKVDTEDKGVSKIATPSGIQEMTIINESGLYSLILSSKLPTAKKFKRWVTNEVLPTIRKTGGYVANDDMFINNYLPFADDVTKMLFKTTLETVRKQNELISKQKKQIKTQEKEISYKEDVIIGLVDNIDLAEKRQRITQIIRKNANHNYAERYGLLYAEFERKFHCDLSRRIESCDIKPRIKNKMDYIDRVMNMIPQLYEIACKLFENDVEILKREWDSTCSKY